MKNKVSSEDIFQCTMCGVCCVGYGGTYVTEEDIANISEYTGVDKETFVEKYCNISGGKPVLAINDENGKCIFFTDKCSIHPVKPRMCRAWPFIEGVVKQPENWKLMASCCEGIRTNFEDEDIVRCVKEELKKL